MIAFFITAGLVIFNMSKILNQKASDKKEENFMQGLILVLMSLGFDGLTQTQTDKNHKEKSRDFAYPSMFTNNLIGLFLSGAMYTFGAVTEGDDTLQRIISSPDILSECVIWGLAGSVG